MKKFSGWQRKFFSWIVSLLVLFIFASEAQALMLELSHEDLTAEADLIIVGKVQSTESQWNETQTNIFTTVEIAVVKVLQGQLDESTVEIVVPGGEADGITEYVSNAPAFKEGEKSLLYLNKQTQEFSTQSHGQETFFEVSGHFQGKLPVENDAVGKIPIKSLKEDISILEDVDIKNPESRKFSTTADDKVVVASNESVKFVKNGRRWPDDHLQIGYKIRASGDKNDHVQAAAETWNSIDANFSFEYKGEVDHDENVSFNGQNEIIWHSMDNQHVLALAYVWASGSTIREANFVYNSDFAWSTEVPSPPGRYDVQTVALHEFGHWLGLGDHYEMPELVMYYKYTGIKRDLHAGDIAGAKHIYADSLKADADLSILEVSVETLDPGFEPDAVAYYAEVNYFTDEIKVTATLSDENASLEVNGKAATSGKAALVDLDEAGSETDIEIKVTAADGETEKIYTITVKRLDADQTFNDFSVDHQFYNEIEMLVALGITEGYDDGTFRPSDTVTRMAMAAFLSRALTLDEKYDIPAEASFSDVPLDHPFYEEIELLAASGITKGYDDGTFRPSDTVTRMAMAAFLSRALALDEKYDVPAEASFSDVPLDHPFNKEIELLAAAEITTGYDDLTFRPSNTVTRMAMAAFLIRGLELE